MLSNSARRLVQRRNYDLHSIHRYVSSTSNPFHGVWPIITTPFNQDETIDFKSFEKIINFFSNEVEVNGLTIIGVLGESNRLLDDERKELISIATNISSKPVCVGTSHQGTTATIKLSQDALACGASSLMITPSREPVPDQLNNIINYYKKIHNELNNDTQIVLQDHPASTLVHINIDSMKTIIKECNSIKCIKLESLPSPPKIRNLIPWINNNNHDVTILTGLGALYGMFDLECNAHGFMTGFAFPEILQSLYQEQIINQNNLIAKKLYQKYLPLLVFEQQPSIVIRKELYKIRGLLESTHVRHPGKNSTDDTIKQLLDWTEFIIGKNVDFTKPLKMDILNEL